MKKAITPATAFQTLFWRASVLAAVVFIAFALFGCATATQTAPIVGPQQFPQVQPQADLIQKCPDRPLAQSGSEADRAANHLAVIKLYDECQSWHNGLVDFEAEEQQRIEQFNAQAKNQGK